jgi:hypothetical protein
MKNSSQKLQYQLQEQPINRRNRAACCNAELFYKGSAEHDMVTKL